MVLPPVVLTEVLSFPSLPTDLARLVSQIPILELAEGYWERAGAFRANLLEDGLKARLGDALIATSCIDADTLLITRDPDFRHYQRHGLRITGLKQQGDP
jgi:predicted nucleic acid-binding protein